MKLNFLIALSVVIANVLVSLNAQLCEITKQSEGKELPNLPDQFQTHIEHNFQGDSLNYTTEYDEYYDLYNKRATVVKYIENKLEKKYFLYATNELISITGLNLIAFYLKIFHTLNRFIFTFMIKTKSAM